MARAGYGVLLGPYPWWGPLFPPTPGYRWVYLTDVNYSYLLMSGAMVSFPMPYQKPVPLVRAKTNRDYYAEYFAMIDEAGELQKPGKWEPSKDPFISKYPTLNRYLTDFWWEKPVVKPRTPCTLAVTFFAGSVQVSLNDKGKRRSMHTTAETVTGAMEALEAYLADGGAPWRSGGNEGGKK